MNNLFNSREVESYEIRFKDIDPDTGNISQDQLVLVVEGIDDVAHMLETLAKEYMDTEHDPNRVFYFKPYVQC